MMLRCVGLCLGIVAFIVMFESAAVASFIDDFSDGDDVGWTRLTHIVSGLPGIFDASSGRYEIASTGVVAENDTAVVARWEDSLTNPAFSDGVLTATASVATENTTATLSLRGNGSGSTYVFSLNNALDELFILGFGPTRSHCAGFSCYDVLGSSPFSISENTDYILQASAFGSSLAFRVWEASGAMPVEAQVAVTDAELTQGAFAMSIARYALNAPTAPIAGSFDNVSFVPEPTTGLLLGLGLLGVAVRRRV